MSSKRRLWGNDFRDGRSQRVEENRCRFPKNNFLSFLSDKIHKDTKQNKHKPSAINRHRALLLLITPPGELYVKSALFTSNHYNGKVDVKSSISRYSGIRTQTAEKLV